MNYATEIGTPIQFIKWNKEGYWDVCPATIFKVNDAKVDVVVIGEKENKVYTNVRHEDFRKEGENYWCFLSGQTGGEISKVYCENTTA